VTLSFYKIFGYPTGVGALIARRQTLRKLHRPWFAGGTIDYASVMSDRYYRHEGPESFDNGTIDYLALPAVEIGLRHIARIGIDVIHARVACLTDWLLRKLTSLRHGNGAPLVRSYGPTKTAHRGGTVTLNVYDPDGRFLAHRTVERHANADHISLRTGCFCNPGGDDVSAFTIRNAAGFPAARTSCSYGEAAALQNVARAGADARSPDRDAQAALPGGRRESDCLVILVPASLGGH